MKVFWKSKIFPLLLMLLDVLIFAVIWLATYYLRRYLNPYFPLVINPIDSYLYSLPILLIIWLPAATYYGLYSFRRKLSGLAQLKSVFKTGLVGFIGMMALAFLFKHLELGRSIIILSALFISIYLHISRTILNSYKKALLNKGIGQSRTLIVGAGEAGKKVGKQMSARDSDYLLLGFVDDDPAKQHQAIDGIPVLGSTRELLKIIKDQDIEEVFLAIPSLPHSKLLNLIVQCEGSGVEFKLVSNILEVITSQVKIDEVDEVPVIEIRNGHFSPWQSFMKRVMDMAISSVLLLLLLVPALIIALIIKLDSKGPIIFKQHRVGKDSKPFRLYKFRTMHKETNPYEEAPTNPEDPRITGVGSFLRHTSLDEIPQLFNVLKGDMSMVGPRPEMPFIVERYQEWQKRRLDVKPGITGLWQVAGRKRLPLYLHLEYDFYYIRNQSLLLDIIILLKTIPSVLFGKGAF